MVRLFRLFSLILLVLARSPVFRASGRLAEGGLFPPSECPHDVTPPANELSLSLIFLYLPYLPLPLVEAYSHFESFSPVPAPIAVVSTPTFTSRSALSYDPLHAPDGAVLIELLLFTFTPFYEASPLFLLLPQPTAVDHSPSSTNHGLLVTPSTRIDFTARPPYALSCSGGCQIFIYCAYLFNN